MPLHNIIVILAFGLLGVSVFLIGKKQKISASEIRGRPSIEPFFFYSGKIALFCSVILFLIKAVFPHFGYIHVPSALSWIAVGLLCFSGVIMVLAIQELGLEIKMGLPEQKTRLHTGGMYRFSRNPLYTTLSLMAIASCLYFPDLINITMALYGFIVHHFIIKAEENYLSEQFKSEWDQYALKVRRYF